VEVTEKEVASLRQKLVDALEGADGPEEKIKAYIKARCRMIAEIAGLFSLFKQEYMQYYSYIRKVQDKFLDFERGCLEGNIREAVSKGLFRECDVEFTAYSIGRAMHAMEYYFGTSVKAEDMEKKASEFAGLFLDGVRKRQESSVARG